MDTTMILTLAIGGSGLLAGAVYAWLHYRDAAPQEEFLLYRCPGCEQKLRFAPQMGGKPANCPRCRRVNVLPRKSQTKVVREAYRVRRMPAGLPAKN